MQIARLAAGLRVLGIVTAGFYVGSTPAGAAEPHAASDETTETVVEHVEPAEGESTWVAQADSDELNPGVLSCVAADAEFVAIGRLNVPAMAGAGWFTADQIERLLRVADEAAIGSVGVSVRDASSWAAWVTDEAAAACFDGARLSGSVRDAVSTSGGNAVQRGSAWLGEAAEMLVVGNAEGVAMTQTAVLADVSSPLAETLRDAVDSETLVAFLLRPDAEPGVEGLPVPGLTSALMVMSTQGVLAQAEFDTPENAANAQVMAQRMIALWRAQLAATIQSQGVSDMLLGAALVAVTQEAVAIAVEEQLLMTVEDRTLTIELNVEGVDGNTFFYPMLAGVMLLAISGVADGERTDAPVEAQ